MADYTIANLRLPSRIYEELRHHSRRRGVSLASRVREAVAQSLGHEQSGAAIPLGADRVDEGLPLRPNPPPSDSLD